MCLYIASMTGFPYRNTQITDPPIGDVIDPAMHPDVLSPLPRVAHGVCISDIRDLFLHIHLNELLEGIRTLPGNGGQRLKPAPQGCLDSGRARRLGCSSVTSSRTSTPQMASYDNMTDIELVDSIRQHRRSAIVVRMKLAVLIATMR